ncbi:uncharacterized protein LOC127724594 [Mytilus californianus]|uniref:uncharacterized protein LOC127724594 n=1 Tax=Mytilus californianus TaxID=6549 RepID=UPI002247A6B8|nr:uncharacterized protein LOC127724594 [Mytilus californianus]
MPECELCDNLEPKSTCKLCDNWLGDYDLVKQSSNTDIFPYDIAAYLPTRISPYYSLVSDILEPVSEWTLQEESYGFYLTVSFVVFILFFVVRKTTRNISSKVSTGLRQHAPEKHKNRRHIGYSSVTEKSIISQKQPRDIDWMDKLRKIKKPQKHVLSKQGMIVLKKMHHSSGDGCFNVLTEESCRLVSVRSGIPSKSLRVFDLRGLDDVPDNVMSTLLCVRPQCTQHPHKSIQKYGPKLVCDADAFGLEHVDDNIQRLQLGKDNDADVENLYHDGGYSNSKAGDNLMLDEDNQCNELGPPCASSSFISNTSSMSIPGEQNDSNLSNNHFDPFSSLDESSTPNVSHFQKYLDTSVTWFGGLYSYSRETSFASFRRDNLDESVSCGLDELEKSLDISKMQKSLSLYGFETDSVFQLLTVYLAKQVIGKVKEAWVAIRTKTAVSNAAKSSDYNNNQLGKELDITGFAVYNSKYNYEYQNWDCDN